METRTYQRRPRGSGSIYQRSRDGMWMAAFTVSAHPRKRKIITAATRERLEEKLRALGLPVEAPERPPSRETKMQAARALGTHTGPEWARVCRATQTCTYCATELTPFNDAKDHKVPVSRGGSDGIENLQRICWQCNVSKGALTHEEYTYSGPIPRPFEPSPLQRRAFLRMVERAREHQRGQNR